MAITRRRFLRLGIGVGLLAASGYLFKTVLMPSKLSSYETGVLKAYLDTLIPPGDAPSASALGVLEKILEDAQADNALRRIIKKGCAWLDDMAGKRGSLPFASLGESDRDDIVELASHARGGSPEAVFFERIRTPAFSYYYSQVESWPYLGYDGPPQPKGFIDYAQPWENHS
jgi:hypothetical protein